MFSSIVSFSLLIVLVSMEPAVNRTYHCDRSPNNNTCMIERITYHPGDNISFAETKEHVRLGPFVRAHDKIDEIPYFDLALYQALGKPVSVEMLWIHLTRVHIPEELEVGIFASNVINSVEIPSNQSSRLVHLDLQDNYIEDIGNLSLLTKLETLNLQRNLISKIDGLTIAPLVHLKVLKISIASSMSNFPLENLSKAIVYLKIYYTSVDKLSFRNLNFPHLHELSLQHCKLDEFDVDDLLKAAPSVKKVFLEGNQLDSKQAESIHKALTEAQIETDSVEHMTRFCTFSGEENCIISEYDDLDEWEVQKPHRGTWARVLGAVFMIVVIALLITSTFYLIKYMRS